MQTILAPHQLCSAIFDVKVRSAGGENEYHNLISQTPTKPRIDFNEILPRRTVRDLQRRLSNETDFVSVLHQSNFKHQFDETSLHKYQNKSVLQHINERDVQSVLYSYVSWFANNDKQSESQVILLLSSINILLNNTVIFKNATHRQLLISAFYNLYNTYMSSKKVTNYQRFISELRTFFVKYPSLPREVCGLLTVTARQVVKPSQKSFDEVGKEFYIFIDSLIVQYERQLPVIALKHVVQIACSALNGLDSNALILFTHLHLTFDVDVILEYLPILPLALISSIESQEPITKYEKLNNDIITTDGFDQTKSKFITHDTFQGTIDLTNRISFEEPIPLESLIPQHLCTKLMLIVKTLQTDKRIVYSFFQMLPHFIKISANSHYSYDFFAAIFFIFSQLKDVFLPIELIGHQIVLDPHITIFNPSSNWKNINSLRSHAIELLISQGIVAIQTVLFSTMRWPALFAEVINRFRNLQQLIKLGPHDISLLSQTLITCSQQFVQYANIPSNLFEAINQARLGIFVFFNDMFVQPSLLKLFFEDIYFIENYMCFLYEAPVRPVVLMPLLNYLTTDGSIENEQLTNKIIQTVENVIKSINQVEAVSLIVDLLKILNKVLALNQDYVSKYSELTSILCANPVELPDESISCQYYVQVLEFLTESAIQHNITMPELAALEKGIMRVFHGEPSKQLFGKILQLIAGQPLPSFHPSFSIRQPKALRLLIEVFSESKMLIDIFSFVATLCQSSTYNCEQAHNGEFDYYLIQKIDEFRKSNNIPINVIAASLSLIMMISSTVSSVSVVQKYITLLCPIDGKFYPKYHNIVIKSLSNMLEAAQKHPQEAIPFDKNSAFDGNNIKVDDINNGFTFSFWIYNNTFDPNYKPQIFLLVDSKSQKLAVFLNSNNLLVYLESGDQQWTGKPDVQLEGQKWSLVTITATPTKDLKYFQVYTTVDGGEPRDFFFPYLKFAPGIGRIRVGGVAIDSITVDLPSLLGPVGLFPSLESQSIQAIHDISPSSAAIQSLNPIFYLVPNDEDGNLCYQNIAKESTVTIQKHYVKSQRSVSFADILINRCKVEILLPLFAQWDLKYQNGDDFPFFDEITIELLESALLLNEDAQRQFEISDGFKIISHLMSKSGSKHLAYNIYLRFFNLFGLLTCENLRKQLFDYILMNIDLWIKCDAENHRRICRHWSRILVPGCLGLTTELRSFAWIISILRIYYWYEPVEANIICKDRVRSQKLNVKDCRRSILDIAHMIVSEKFTEEDFKNIMSHILTCTDHEQNVDNLGFLNILIREQTSVFSEFQASVHLISLLQYLFNATNVDLICSILTTIVDAHHAKLIDGMELNNHIDIILHQFTPLFVTKNVLSRLITLTNSNPELFPICSWMAMNIGNAGIREMLGNLKASPRFCTSESWAIYIVASLFQVDEKLRRYISRFLVNCSIDNLDSLIACVEVIGRALNGNTRLITEVLLTEFGKMIIKQGETAESKNIDSYFRLVNHFIFFHSEETKNEAIEAVREQQKKIKKTKRNNRRITIHSPDRMGRPSGSPNRRRKQRASRHSLHPNAILEQQTIDRYSPLLAERAQAVLNPIYNVQQQLKNSYKSRRTSLMTFGKKPIDYEPKQAEEKVVISMMPSDLDNKISEIAQQEIKYTFCISMNKDGKWKESELAAQAINVFLSKPDFKHSESVLTISSFLIHSKPELVHDLIKKLNTNNIEVPAVFHLLAHHCKLAGEPTILENYSQQTAFEYLETFASSENMSLSSAPLRFLKHLIRFQAFNSEKAFDIFAMISDKIVSTATNVMADVSDTIGQKKSSSSRRWSNYWHTMTNYRAPWNKSLPSISVKQIHYKRDSTACSCLCPMKLKRNFKFTDHHDASLMRDCGNHRTVQECLEKYRAELAKIYAENAPSPLMEVVENIDEDSETETIQIARCIIELPCEIIKVRKVTTGIFSLLNNAIVLSKENGKTTIIKHEDIVEIFHRTRFHHPTAIEVFTTTGRSYFINFVDVKSFPILRSFSSLNLPNARIIQTTDSRSMINSLKVAERWMKHKMSNFEYLMQLNVIAGRSFNDPSQYPVMPWILSNYSSEKIDLKDIRNYRDLSKPIGAVTKSRLVELKEKQYSYKSMGMEPYLYSSGYVNPLNVYLYLIRTEPFTSLHIEIQSGKFDHAARLFGSIEAAYKMCTHNQNDYRELIPEFFFNADFLINKDKYDLGNLDGQPVNDVELPKWASSPYEFIYLHRKALESDVVSANLEKWIDLIFGYKQSGEKAIEADNVFLPQMYNNIWTPQIEQDPGLRAQIEAIKCHVGQIPMQLFDQPHPRRFRSSRIQSPLQQAISLNLQTSSIIASSITLGNRKVRVASIDDLGLSLVTCFDLNMLGKIKPKISSPKKNNGRRSNGKQVITSSVYETVCSNDSVVFSKTIKSFNEIKSIEQQNQKVVANYQQKEDSFFIVGAIGTNLHKIRVRSTESEVVHHQRSEIVSVSSSRDLLSIADNDSVLTLYKIGDFSHPIFSIPTFTSSICCSSISSTYHTIVCGTRDSNLLLCSLSTHTISRVVDLDGARPLQVLITPAWGFIVVYMTKIETGNLEHFLSLYSINGDLIKMKKIEHGVVSWSTFKSEDGFDFIVMADSANRCFSFEAFFLELGESIFVNNSPISQTSFDKENSTAVFVTQNGKIIFVPI